MLCVFLVLAGCDAPQAAKHRRLHSVNARTACYTMSVGALVKSCAKMLDCTEQLDGTYTLDALPDTVCWNFDEFSVLRLLQNPHILLALAGAIGLVLLDGGLATGGWCYHRPCV